MSRQVYVDHRPRSAANTTDRDESGQVPVVANETSKRLFYTVISSCLGWGELHRVGLRWEGKGNVGKEEKVSSGCSGSQGQ